MATKKPESAIINQMVKHLRQMRANSEEIYWLKLHGNQYQRAGTPDLHITYRGRSLWVEVKTDTGSVTKLQEHELTNWKSAGAVVGIARNVDDLSSILLMIHDLS